jgi:hypothetical protein
MKLHTCGQAQNFPGDKLTANIPDRCDKCLLHGANGRERSFALALRPASHPGILFALRRPDVEYDARGVARCVLCEKPASLTHVCICACGAMALDGDNDNNKVAKTSFSINVLSVANFEPQAGRNVAH